ncbi:hypothetical protein PIB30_047959, partial [Stylosanthes scabra]|nr:hypothetical protein [Stylosanthes scabra]
FCEDVGNLFGGCDMDWIICEVHSEKVVAKNRRRELAGLSEFEEKIGDPLDFSESGCEGAILCLDRAPANSVRAKEDAEASGGSAVVRVGSPV